MLTINIAGDFSYTPGPRKKEEGEFSAELFLDEILIPKFSEAIESGSELLIVLDGTAGYSTLFLEGAFGQLVRMFSKKDVKSILRFKSEEEPYLIDEINYYIENAEE